MAVSSAPAAAVADAPGSRQRAVGSRASGVCARASLAGLHQPHAADRPSSVPAPGAVHAAAGASQGGCRAGCGSWQRGSCCRCGPGAAAVPEHHTRGVDGVGASSPQVPPLWQPDGSAVRAHAAAAGAGRCQDAAQPGAGTRQAAQAATHAAAAAVAGCTRTSTRSAPTAARPATHAAASTRQDINPRATASLGGLAACGHRAAAAGHGPTLERHAGVQLVAAGRHAAARVGVRPAVSHQAAAAARQRAHARLPHVRGGGAGPVARAARGGLPERSGTVRGSHATTGHAQGGGKHAAGAGARAHRRQHPAAPGGRAAAPVARRQVGGEGG
mmetsp:Transcript_11360/g.27811  ORF Transcript_11360/g.27811 Transcript_11360/m.27811 type:complete len:330 (-) Transcript_11360:1767-2756(-)